MTDSKLGTFVWTELLTTDLAKAKGFYGELLGWSMHEMDLGPAGAYVLLKNGEADAGGMMNVPQPGIPSHWLAYICVDDVDATCEKVKLLGGQIHTGPMDLPNIGRVAVGADPTGAAVAFFTPPAG